LRIQNGPRSISQHGVRPRGSIEHKLERAARVSGGRAAGILGGRLRNATVRRSDGKRIRSAEKRQQSGIVDVTQKEVRAKLESHEESATCFDFKKDASAVTL